jgi:hypothetical protein
LWLVADQIGGVYWYKYWGIPEPPSFLLFISASSGKSSKRSREISNLVRKKKTTPIADADAEFWVLMLVTTGYFSVGGGRALP